MIKCFAQVSTKTDLTHQDQSAENEIKSNERNFLHAQAKRSVGKSKVSIDYLILFGAILLF